MLIGIDPSLSSTGICIISEDGTYIHADQITSDKSDPIHVRCRGIARQVLSACSVHEDDVWCVFCEEPGGDLQGEAGDLRTLFWFIVDELCSWEHADVTICSISPNGLKKFISDNGHCTPGDKAYNVSQKWMHILPKEYHATDATKPKGLLRWADMWDALALCMVGRMYLGLADGWTKAQQEAVANVKQII